MTRKKAAETPTKKWFYPYCRTKQGFCNADGNQLSDAVCSLPDICGYFLVYHPVTGYPPTMLKTYEDGNDLL